MTIQSHFNIDRDIIYVNHAAVAPWPQCAVDAVKSFAEENGRKGSRHYAQWLKIETSLRHLLATIINAPSADDIALVKNTSEGLSVIAWGLDWKPGDNIIIAAEEFPSNRIVWESLSDLGVSVRMASVTASGDPEQALIDLINDRTRLLSISAVQYTSGLRMNLKRLGEACRMHDVLFCVDAIQHIGAIQFDTQAIQADFVVADGHKWMLGPEGLALFYCRAELRQQLKLHQFGWHMVEDFSDFNKMQNWQPAATARRFECGSPNLLAAHALHASIRLLLETGMDNVEQLVLDNVQYLIEQFELLPECHILTPKDPSRHAGIFTFSIGNRNLALYSSLVEQGVVCAVRGGVRFSPHFHTSREQLALLVNKVRDWLIKNPAT